MISVNPYKQGSGALPSVHIPGLVKLADNRAEGMSTDDSANAADGTLYPSNLNTTLTSQTQITTAFLTEAQKYFNLDDENLANNTSKLKVAEKFFNKYTKLQALNYSAFTGNAAAFTTGLSVTDIIKCEWLDASRIAMLYLDETSGIILKFAVGQIQTDGSITWGSAVSVKTFTDATHRSVGWMGFAKTDTDKVLVTYTNKVSTNYWTKGRVITIATTTCTLQAESADLVNLGTSAPNKSYAWKIRGASGAGAVITAHPAASAGSTVSNINVLQHDNANTVTAGTPTSPGSPTDFGGAIAFHSYATDKFIVLLKQSGTQHVHARIGTVSGTTITMQGAGVVQLTNSTSSSHVVPTNGHAIVDFGSNIAGAMYSLAGNTGIQPLSYASDTLTVAGDFTTIGLNNDLSNIKGINLNDNSGLLYLKSGSGGSPIQTVRAFYANGVITCTSGTDTNQDANAGTSLTQLFISATRALFMNTNTNLTAGSTMYYQIGAGDCVIEIRSAADVLLATITETNDGAYTKMKALNIAWAAARLIMKIKNTSGGNRKIKISAVYAQAE